MYNSVLSDQNHKTFSSFRNVLKPIDIISFRNAKGTCQLRVSASKVVHLFLLVAIHILILSECGLKVGYVLQMY